MKITRFQIKPNFLVVNEHTFPINDPGSESSFNDLYVYIYYNSTWINDWIPYQWVTSFILIEEDVVTKEIRVKLTYGTKSGVYMLSKRYDINIPENTHHIESMKEPTPVLDYMF